MPRRYSRTEGVQLVLTMSTNKAVWPNSKIIQVSLYIINFSLQTGKVHDKLKDTVIIKFAIIY